METRTISEIWKSVSNHAQYSKSCLFLIYSIWKNGLGESRAYSTKQN